METVDKKATSWNVDIIIITMFLAAQVKFASPPKIQYVATLVRPGW